MSSLEVILIFIYLVGFSLVILKTKIFESPYVSKSFLVKVLALKTLFGFLYAYIHFENGWQDTFMLFLNGKHIAQVLFESPELYFKLVTGQIEKPLSPEITAMLNGDEMKKYFQERSSFTVKVNALLIPFTYGYYSVLTVFYEMISLVGLFYIYRVIAPKFSFNSRLLKYFLFFAPSFLFWFSGVHKEALTIFGIGIILYASQEVYRRRWGHILLLLFGLAFTYLARDYALFILVPALFALVASLKMPKRPYLPYIITYGFCSILFFVGRYISPKLNFPELFVGYQKNFMRLKGESNFEMVPLEPTIESFATSVPIALFNSLFKPNFSHTHTFWSTLAAIENVTYVIFTIVFLFFLNTKRLTTKQKSYITAFLFFGLSYFILLGLIVDNVGAIVRYKSIPLVFFGSALIILFDVSKFERFLKLSPNSVGRWVHRRKTQKVVK